MDVPVPPHNHPFTPRPKSELTDAALAPRMGVNVTVPPLTVAFMPVTVALITPLSSVANAER